MTTRTIALQQHSKEDHRRRGRAPPQNTTPTAPPPSRRRRLEATQPYTMYSQDPGFPHPPAAVAGGQQRGREPAKSSAASSQIAYRYY
jgi:hypothetical protein